MLTTLLRAFNIRLRMIGAIAMVIVLLGMVGTTGFYGLNQVQAKSDEFSGIVFRDAQVLSTLREAVGKVRRAELDVVLAAGSRDEASAHLVRWQQAV